MNIFQPPYVYTKRKRHIVGEIVLWIVCLPILLPALMFVACIYFTAFVMSVWSYWRF